MEIVNFGIFNKTRNVWLGANFGIESCSEYSSVAVCLEADPKAEVYPWQTNNLELAEKAISNTVDPLFSSLREPENPYIGEELEIRQIVIQL